MKRIRIMLLALAVLATGWTPVAGSEAGDSGGRVESFEALKALEGDWARIGEDGKPAASPTITYRVTAGGAALLETVFPGTSHEMVTLYHLEGDGLVLTHYCIEGNQPHMRLKSHSADQLDFECPEGAKLDSENARHMHSGSFTFLGPDRIKTEWRRLNNGENDYTASFELVRVSGADGR